MTQANKINIKLTYLIYYSKNQGGETSQLLHATLQQENCYIHYPHHTNPQTNIKLVFLGMGCTLEVSFVDVP